jgi:hypothetical protein
MIIPAPKFEHIPYNLAGKSAIYQWTYTWIHPPRFRITEDWIIILDDGTPVIIPKGFETDFASVPWLFWRVLPPDGVALEGSIVHDFGYQYGYLLSPKVWQETIYTGKAARLFKSSPMEFNSWTPVKVGASPEFFNELMAKIVIVTNGASAQANTMRTILDLVGFRVWNKYRTRGPKAYNTNSLGLPGVDKRGEVLEGVNK